jgi:phage tail protein X
MAETQYVTKQPEMLDYIAFKAYGKSVGATEAIYAANPGLADYGPFLPPGLTIVLPDLSSDAPQLQTVKLWG